MLLSVSLRQQRRCTSMALESEAEMHEDEQEKVTNPLHAAVERGEYENVRQLLFKGCDVNTQNCDGHTPLHTAVSRRDLETMKLLLAHGADVNARDEIGWTPLHLAIVSKGMDMVKCLLSHGADPHACDNLFSLSPFDLSEAYDLTQLRNVLLSTSSE